jgi:hypothetical protein
MKRLMTLAAIVSLMAVVAPPAHAQAAISVSLSGVASGSTVEGIVYAGARASSTEGVDSLQILINGVTVASTSPSGIRQNAETGYNWDTRHAVNSSSLSQNGTYTVRVVGVSNGGARDEASASIHVNNPASTPTGVTASTLGNTSSVSWNANPEPDILRYRVERDSGSGFATVTETQGTSFAEELSPGTHTYRITAIRYSPAGGSRASAPSGGAAVSIEAPASSGGGDGGSYTEGGGSNTSGGNGGVANPFGPGATVKKGGFVNPFGGSGGIVTKKKGAFYIGGKRIAISGLPTGFLRLPGMGGGLPQLPESEGVKWGKYDEILPYDVPSGAVPLGSEGSNIAARSPWRVIPPDGLRWLAAGLLAIVAAALSRFLAGRIEDDPFEAPALTVVEEGSDQAAA